MFVFLSTFKYTVYLLPTNYYVIETLGVKFNMLYLNYLQKPGSQLKFKIKVPNIGNLGFLASSVWPNCAVSYYDLRFKTTGIDIFKNTSPNIPC